MPCDIVISSGITQPFGWLSQAPGQISDALLTRAPLDALLRPVRLACLNHADSVQAEPGSNSSINFRGSRRSPDRSRFPGGLVLDESSSDRPPQDRGDGLFNPRSD